MHGTASASPDTRARRTHRTRRTAPRRSSVAVPPAPTGRLPRRFHLPVEPIREASGSCRRAVAPKLGRLHRSRGCSGQEVAQSRCVAAILTIKQSDSWSPLQSDQCTKDRRQPQLILQDYGGIVRCFLDTRARRTDRLGSVPIASSEVRTEFIGQLGGSLYRRMEEIRTVIEVADAPR